MSQHEETMGHQPERFQIQIDRVHFTVAQEHMTGAALRQVPPTPISPDRDLFEVIPGGPDRKIGDTDVVAIRNGKRFFTAPSQINPGDCRNVQMRG
jgi:Multiubiquitin